MITIKSWALTGVLALLSAAAVVTAVAPAFAAPVGCYKCFIRSGGGATTMGCASGYAGGGTGCSVSGGSCSITGRCGV